MHFHDCTGSPETVRLIYATHFSGVESIDRAWNTHIRVLQTLFRYSVRLDISFCVDTTITRIVDNQLPPEHSHHPSRHRNNPPSIIRQIYHARSSAIEFSLKETQEHLLKHNDLVSPINTLLYGRLTLSLMRTNTSNPTWRSLWSRNATSHQQEYRGWEWRSYALQQTNLVPVWRRCSCPPHSSRNETLVKQDVLIVTPSCSVAGK